MIHATPELLRGLNEPRVLREYALLADGERGVLVGPRGEFAWMCFPQWDGDAFFSTLLGGPGAYAVTPEGRFVWGGYYENDTLIWRSRWITEDSIVECREALALPADRDRAVVLRRVVAAAGAARVRVVLNLRHELGARPVKDLHLDDTGVWRGRLGEVRVSWSGAADAEAVDDGQGGRALELSIALETGAQHDLLLAFEGGERSEPPLDPDWAWQGTEAAWRERTASLPQALGARDARQAHAVLWGLTSEGGGMVAAATTSLPERARQGRNFDYRYVWIRDQSYAGQAAAKARSWELLDRAVGFVRDRLLSDGSRLRPAYTVRGEDLPDQRHVDLPGYPGGSSILGNQVTRQFQLDPFGEALLLFATAAGEGRMESADWKAAELAVEAIRERWREPDAGVWELEPDEWTHSRLICVAGLRALAEHQPAGNRTADWLSLADRIRADTAYRATHPDGYWQRSPSDPRLDASLLLAAIRGAVSPEDPRSVATLRAVSRELTRDGYVYRFRPDDEPLGVAEGAFLLCSFWLSLAFARQGELIAAARAFERGRSAAGPPGLLSEEFDVDQRQLRGNLPQAFVHALLLESAVELSSFGVGE